MVPESKHEITAYIANELQVLGILTLVVEEHKFQRAEETSMRIRRVEGPLSLRGRLHVVMEATKSLVCPRFHVHQVSRPTL